MASVPIYENIHGRRAGRGIRPYLLFPKFIFVAVFLGGLVSLFVLTLVQSAPVNAEDWRRQAELTRRIYTLVVVPALLGAMLMGVLLSSMHFGAFIRRRWLQIKLILVVVCVPGFHDFMRGRSLALQAKLAEHDFAAANTIHLEMKRGTALILVLALVVIFLGRIKPRLGQDYARAVSQKKTHGTESVGE